MPDFNERLDAIAQALAWSAQQVAIIEGSTPQELEHNIAVWMNDEIVIDDIRYQAIVAYGGAPDHTYAEEWIREYTALILYRERRAGN